MIRHRIKSAGEAGRARPRKRRGSRSRGSALVLVLVGLLVIMTLAGAVTQMSVFQTRSTGRYEVYKDEFCAAEAAMNKAFAHIQFLVNSGAPNFDTQVAAVKAPTIPGFTFSKFTITKTATGTEVNGGTTQQYMTYAINVKAKKTTGIAAGLDHPGISLNETLKLTYIPIYQYAIFYNPLMEISPGPYMQVTGKVHSNTDTYVGSGAGLDFLKDVTVAGSLYHGRAPNSGQTDGTADVTFTTDGSTKGSSMKVGSNWLDAKTAGWASTAQTRWNGHVGDKAMGVGRLDLPIPSGVDPHTIIERANPALDSYSVAAAKFENQAGLKIIVDSAGVVKGYNQAGAVVPLTYTSGATTVPVYTLTTFFDEREKKQVTSVDVDLGKMKAGGIFPANGILYVSNEDRSGMPGVVRLINGSQLPTSPTVAGFTVATDDPLYVKGDYNTVNKTLAMIACDALNILSNAWTDATATRAISARVGSATTTNAVFITGNVPTGSNQYSGGVENFYRYHENWSGKRHTVAGSIIDLWASTKFKALWSSASYNPPDRYWSWDTNLGGLNGPPGAPRMYKLVRTSWKRVS